MKLHRASVVDRLPVGWVADVEDLLERFARQVVLDGSFATFGTAQRPGPRKMRVVTGDHIHADLSWLWLLYRTAFLDIAQNFYGQALVCSSDILSSVNINALDGVGAEYERHADTNPVTGLLFVSSSEGRGGEFVLESVDGEAMLVEAISGELIVFDGSQLLHRVAPLTADWTRISIPMNYYLQAHEQEDRRRLNQYLYSL